MLQKESQVVTGASLRKGPVQAIPVCVRLASFAMSMSASQSKTARAALRAQKDFWQKLSRGLSRWGRKWADRLVLAANVRGAAEPPAVIRAEEEGGLRSSKHLGDCDHILYVHTHNAIACDV